MKNQIYLDHNASTPMRPKALALMTELLQVTANPSAIHKNGRILRAHIEKAREQVAAAVGGTAEYVIFTSGATEANITVLNGCKDVRHVIVSDIEHPSVKKACDNILTFPASRDGLIRLDKLEELLKTCTEKGGGIMVSVMLVNNESGVIQPVTEVAALARQYGAFFHTDAAQALGRIPVDLTALDADALTLSAHKVGGPQGVGAIVLRDGFTLDPLFRGGKQEKSRRAGTENSAGIAAFGAAAEEAAANVAEYQKLAVLRDHLEAEILRMSPEVVIFGKSAPRAPNTSFFSTPGLESQPLMIAFDLEGIAVTAGTACSSGSTRKSTVLEAMQATPEEQASSLRVSMGWASKPEDVAGFLAAWQKIYTRMKNRAQDEAGARLNSL
ncbi:MAG: cysteine desulfurase [Pseudomonadota bacterium]|nr:cysteine desulfurase [Pseudomonadota bacterium]QKK04999.1 MAG: cysteine desulfurase [Pseudomonadota bacterium]